MYFPLQVVINILISSIKSQYMAGCTGHILIQTSFGGSSLSSELSTIDYSMLMLDDREKISLLISLMCLPLHNIPEM